MKDFTFLYFLLILSFLVLVSRLFYLQIVKGREYELMAKENRIRIEKIRAFRGVIYDRNGEVLVNNTPEGRQYLYAKETAHVLGFLREADEEEIKDKGYKLADLVGKEGVEKFYDKILRGEDGGIIQEVSADGKVKREMGKVVPIAGKNLKLAIDLRMQKIGYEALAGRRGALVASTPDGRILSLVSSPSFDPNHLEDFLDKPDQPFFNRAISGLYPPGSTFKIITSLGALQEKVIDKDTQIEDTGEIKIGAWRFGNWYFDKYGKKEGTIGLVTAIKRSNDIFFYRLGERLGIRRMANWAKFFKIDKFSGIDLPGEAKGRMPEPQWKEDFKGEDWFLGDTFISAIGQGDILMTPLAVNLMTGVVANGGRLCQPQVKAGEEPKCEDLKIKLENLNLVKEGMREVCSEGGTAPVFFDFKPQVACKTGTAEIAKDKNPHAWFTVFSPVDEPEIVLTVILEEAGEGSEKAAPVAKKVLEEWFKNQ